MKFRFPKKVLQSGICLFVSTDQKWANLRRVRGNKMMETSTLEMVHKVDEYSLPETNRYIAPENRPGPKRKRESIPTIHFQVRAISFREGNRSSFESLPLAKCALLLGSSPQE